MLGYSVAARCDRRSDFPEEGVDVSSVGTANDACRARVRSAWTAVGVEMSEVWAGSVAEDRNMSTPCTFTIRGLVTMVRVLKLVTR